MLLFNSPSARLQQGTSAEATTLIKLLLDQNTPAAVKARVADSIFNHAAKTTEIEDIEARVSPLEVSMGADRERAGKWDELRSARIRNDA